MQPSGIIVIIVVIIGFFALITLIFKWRESQRKKVFKEVADKKGFTFGTVFPNYLKLPHQGWFSDGKYSLNKYHLYRKEQGEEIFLFEAIRDDGPSDGTYFSWPTMALVWSNDINLPPFVFGPHGVVSRVIKFFKKDQNDKEEIIVSSPAFHQKYQIAASDNKAVGELFDDQLVDFLLKVEPPLFIEGFESGFLVYQDSSRLLMADKMVALIDRAQELTKIIRRIKPAQGGDSELVSESSE